MTKLDSHFNIFTQQKLKEETKNIDTNNDRQLDSFLQKIILRIHHKIIRVPKKSENDAEERERKLREKFLKERSDFAQILYNKACTYMNNAVRRKSKINSMEKGLLVRMKKNDELVRKNIVDLVKMRKTNSNLIISLNEDNHETSNHLKKCEVLKNISLKCKEMSKIYQSILNSYDEQSEALGKIFKLLKKNNYKIN